MPDRRYRVVRLLSWRAGKNEITRAPGEYADDAPAKVLREFLDIGAVEDTNGEK